MTIPTTCKNCGSDEFEYPENPQPDDMIKCVGCGDEAQFSDIEKQALDAAEVLVKKKLSKFFK